jgi:Ca-activated chloride channel family protein
MKTTRLFLTVLASIVIIALAAPAFAPAQEGDADKTLSPYFLVKSTDPAVDQLPLLSTSAAVNIAGVIADVRVTQVYKNDGKKPIEAIYVFPASTRAAVYAMRMTIGKRIIEAKIEEREKARADYEQAKREGKSASLLEQQRPNVFQMNVANIMPGDTIKVELNYTELLVPTDNIYEFVHPTVVGPRYTNKQESTAKQSDKWVQNPYQKQGEKPSYAFDIAVDVATGVPIQEMTCPTHKVEVEYDGRVVARVTLNKSESAAGNRDFILKYRLAGGKIESGVLLYKGSEENFFLTMVQPPQKVTNDIIPAREYIFIVDVSGSMSGFPLDISKSLLRNLISNLRSTDLFNVVLFAGGSSAMAEKSLPATKANIEEAVKMIDEQSGGGGTELLPALQRALGLPKAENISRSIIIATDGYVDVEVEAFDLIRKNLNRANVFAFGIGSSVNRFLIEGLARVGGGEPFLVSKPEEAQAKAEKLREYILRPVLTSIKASYAGFDAYDVEPLTIPDVLALRPIIIFGKWRGQPQGTISLTGFSGKQEYAQSFDIKKIKATDKNSGLRYFWARHHIVMLGDYNNLVESDERVKEIVKLGIKYNLLTAYTSFVAIDSEIRNKEGQAQTIKQALPLPEGVSNLAVGGGQSHVAASPMMAQKSMIAPRMKLEEERPPLPPPPLVANLGYRSSIQVPVLGKAILYFWPASCADCQKELKQMIDFAWRNQGTIVYLVIVEKQDPTALRKALEKSLAGVSIPGNFLFVLDAQQKMVGTYLAGKAPGIAPVVLFYVDGNQTKSVNRSIGYWRDDTKVMDNFKK